jgi:SAM-dependent methyltransferase
MAFTNSEQSHEHSLQTLNMLYEYDDFMASIGTLVDLGCGSGLDLEWWATRTTRDSNPLPLNIQCVGVDTSDQLPIARKYNNVTYQRTDFESNIHLNKNRTYDVLWSHDSFQYCVNPLETLVKWRDIASESGMLVLIVPKTTEIRRRQLTYHQPSGCYYHHSMTSLMHMLSLTGWDCNSGFFLEKQMDSFIHVVVYKSDQAPRDPKTTTWYDLADSGLLPESACTSIQKYGFLRQEDLLVPWLDHSLTWMGKL